jgi:ATP-binding cassette, subfamily B, bacterial PglK
MLKQLWNHLSIHRKKQFYLLLILMIVASLAEIVSIGAVIPFLGILTAPEQVYQYPLMQPLIKILCLTEPSQLILPLTIAFISAATFAGAIRLTLLYAATKLSFATGADLSINIYRRTLYQEYSTHIARNSSVVINGIIGKTGSAIGIMQAVLNLVSSVIILLGIVVALFGIDAKVAVISLTVLGLLYGGVISFTRQQLKENSNIISEQSTEIVKTLQEGLGGVRDILIDNSQEFYCGLYRSADLSLRRASANNVFIGSSPRYVMEAIGMIVIALLAYMLTQKEGGMVTAIPILGALALGAQKLLPAIQQAYSAQSIIKGARSSLRDVLELLDQPLLIHVEQQKKSPVLFSKEILLKNLKFRYAEEKPWVLENININIAKGSRVGFIGVTGSGKSTLLDIIMGLLPASSVGEFCIDGQPITIENKTGWQKHIAHVPQDIYLSDSTIEENIAFSISKEEINKELVKKVAKQAQISELIEEWDDGYQTFVGERGIRLSGGQRQRIGIARALYKQADVLIFDEATSSLDSETEQAVMSAIENLDRNLTILIVAHRLTTLKDCDKILKLDKRNIVSVGSYEDMIDGLIN